MSVSLVTQNTHKMHNDVVVDDCGVVVVAGLYDDRPLQPHLHTDVVVTLIFHIIL